MQFTFTPTDPTMAHVDVPYIEDARADFAPHYRSSKSITQAQAEVTAELGKLGAGVMSFQDGVFQSGKKRRHGYNIRFFYGGGQGIMRIAGLPIKGTETDAKVKQIKVQGLLVARDWLKAAVTSRVFSPGADVLIPFMLVDKTPGNERTVAEYIAQMGELPQLAAPSDIVEGEFVE